LSPFRDFEGRAANDPPASNSLRFGETNPRATRPLHSARISACVVSAASGRTAPSLRSGSLNRFDLLAAKHEQFSDKSVLMRKTLQSAGRSCPQSRFNILPSPMLHPVPLPQICNATIFGEAQQNSSYESLEQEPTMSLEQRQPGEGAACRLQTEGFPRYKVSAQALPF
jgi:hypothetical protein